MNKCFFLLFLFSIFTLFRANSQQQDSIYFRYFKKGQQFLDTKKFDSSFYYLNKAKKGFLKNDNIKGLAKSYLLLGSLYGFKNQKDSANFYIFECQNIANSLQDKRLEGNLRINIAFHQYRYNDLLGALGNMKQAIQLFEANQDSMSLAVAYNNLAIIHRNSGVWEKALLNNQKSLRISMQLKDTTGIGYSYHNIGKVYHDLHEADSAQYYFEKAIAHNASYKIKNANPYRSYADFCKTQKRYKQSNDLLLKALKIEQSNGVAVNVKSVYKALRDNSTALKNYKKISFYQFKIDSIKKREIQQNNVEKLQQLENQQQLYLKQKELEYAQSVAEKNKIIMLIVVGLLCLTVLFFLQSYRASKLKRKQQQLLLERKVLRAQMNPHFIFNALSAIQNSLLDNNPLKSATFLSRFSKLIRQNFEFVNKETIPLSDDLDALKNYIETQQMRFNHSFDYTIEVDDALDTDLIKIPPMLLQPFVENSIEHGFKNKTTQGQLHLSLKKEGTLLQVVIQDNGVGFDTSKLGKGYHSSSVFKKRLELLSNISEKSFQIQSSNQGTTVQFKLEII